MNVCTTKYIQTTKSGPMDCFLHRSSSVRRSDFSHATATADDDDWWCAEWCKSHGKSITRNFTHCPAHQCLSWGIAVFHNQSLSTLMSTIIDTSFTYISTHNNQLTSTDAIKIIIIITSGQCLCCWHHDSRVIALVHPVHVMNAEQCQTAANLWTKLTDISHRSTCRQLWNYILHHPKAGTHFTIPH